MRQLLAVGRLQAGEGRRLLLAVALAAGATGAAIALLATSGYLISRAAQRPMVIALAVTITAVRTFGLARAVLRYAERLASHELTLRQLARLRSRFFRRLAPLVPGQLGRHGRGELLARFVGDVDAIADLYLRVLIPALVALAVIAGAGVAGWLLMSPGVGAIVAGALGADALVSAWVAGRVGAAAARRQGPVRAMLSGRLVEAVDGSGELALAGASPRFTRELAGIDAELGRLGRRDAGASALAGGAHALISAAGLLGVLVIAVAGVHNHTFSGLRIAAAAFLFLGAREAIAPLPAAAQRARGCATAARRLHEVGDQRPAVADPAEPRGLTGDGALALQGAALAYEAGAPAVLDGVDLAIEPRERVALTGPSGAGKTTLAELLVRFRDPQRGRVLLDGVDVRDVSQADLRRAVLLCGQDAHLFNTTIRQNLLIGDPGASEDRLWRVLDVVELAAWARGLPAGLDTRVGQLGELVSGGQRRRLALARALLSPARFLILDEPVAHLDPPLAARILRRLPRALEGRGALVITHDTRTLEGFHRVLTLADGRLGGAADATLAGRVGGAGGATLAGRV